MSERPVHFDLSTCSTTSDQVEGIARTLERQHAVDWYFAMAGPEIG